VHNPGPGNYSSSGNLGKHQPSWKYPSLHPESATQAETEVKQTKCLARATTT
jgi:hypothetical protein